MPWPSCERCGARRAHAWGGVLLDAPLASKPPMRLAKDPAKRCGLLGEEDHCSCRDTMKTRKRDLRSLRVRGALHAGAASAPSFAAPLAEAMRSRDTGSMRREFFLSFYFSSSFSFSSLCSSYPSCWRSHLLPSLTRVSLSSSLNFGFHARHFPPRTQLLPRCLFSQ